MTDTSTEQDADETFEVDEQGIAYSSESAPSADAPLKPATIAPAAATGRRKEAVARALNAVDLDANRAVLKKAGLLTRDARVIERKKAGLKKARKAPQYSKR